ncbi:MAG: hypothetical protein AB7N91_25115 [Candidatus Tectimicrobiota bacterium]
MPSLSLSLASLMLLIGVGLVQSATLRNPEEAKELAEKILGRAVVGDTESIATVLKPHWSFPEQELDTLVAQTTRQRQQLVHRLGKSIGFALVRRETLADTFMRLTYVEKLENTGLRWSFLFYKAKDTWKFHSFSWDEDVTKLFMPSSQR